MRAVVFDAPGGPAVLHVANVAPPRYGPGDVLVAVEAAGVGRADSLQRRGLYPPPQGASPILGLEVAGTIVEVGEGVSEWFAGDRVCALCSGGGYAELVAVPAGQCLPVPANWSAVEAATLPENVFTVYDNLFTRARLAPAETLLAHGGSSGIGTTAIMLGKAFGARVIVTAGSDEKCDACLRIGASAAINYRTQDFVAQVLSLTDGRGADVILDLVGGDYIPRDLDCLALDGRIVAIAHSRGRQVTLDLGIMQQRRAALIASVLRSRTVVQKSAIARELRDRVWPLLPARDPIAPVLDSVYTFDDAAAAHARLESSEHVGKIVLEP